MKKDISIWLIPRTDQRKSLQKIIDDLSKKYNAYSFIPHITAYYLGTSMKLEEVITITDNATNGTRPFTMNAKNIVYSDIFTKTLYIQFEVSKQLLELYNKLKDHFNKYYEYVLNSHLSLIYKNNMDNKEKENEIKRISYPKNLTFDKIAIITRGGSIITKEKDILDWKIEFEKQL